MGILGLVAALTSRVEAQPPSVAAPEEAEPREGSSPIASDGAAGSVWIVWTAPPVCPSQRELERQIELLLGRPLTAPRRRSIELTGAVSALTSGGYEVAIRARSELGPSERLVRHRDCGSLTEAAALVMALAIDPDALSQNNPTCPALPPDVELRPVPAPIPFRDLRTPTLATPCEVPKPCRCRAALSSCGKRSPARARQPRPRSFDIGVAGGATVGLLRDSAPMAQLSLGATYAEQIRIRMHGRYWQEQEFAIRGYVDATARIRANSLGLRICWLPYRPEWAIAICTGPDVGQLRSTGLGSDFQARAKPTDVWWGWNGGLGLEVPVARPLFVETSVEGGLVLVRPDVGFQDQNAWVQVAQPERASGTLMLAVGAHLP